MARCASKPVPLDAALYARCKAAAKRRFATYPSIYANSWLVAQYKRRGGRYGCSSEPSRGGLRRWYREQWVDLSRPLPGGGWEPCGRPSVDPKHWREKYPKCRPLAEARKLTASQRKSAVRRKRAAVSKQRRGRPTYVRTVPNPVALPLGLFAVTAAFVGLMTWAMRSCKVA
jgi:hypothetical protein